MAELKLTKKEETAIRRLVALGEKWPETLMLFSSPSSLLVVQKGTGKVVARIEGIPNDGGDPGALTDDDGNETLNLAV